MTGQKTIAAWPKSSMIELSALEPLRPMRSCTRLCCLRLWLGCRSGWARIRTRAASWPATRRTPDERYHRAMPRRRRGDRLPRDRTKVPGGGLDHWSLVSSSWAPWPPLGWGAVQLSCWASCFKSKRPQRGMRISNPVVAGSQGQMLPSG